jgi:phosphatidylglycerol lysyltransferase
VMNKPAPMNAELRDSGATSVSGATSLSIEDDPADPSGRNWIDGAPRLWLFASILVVFGGMVAWGIGKETQQIDFPLLVSALRATSPASLSAALAATALSYLALVGYDVSGLRYARAHAPLKTILLASFCGFAIGNSIGLGAFSGGAVRYRLYTAAGLLPGQIVRVILFISIAFGVGLVSIAALGLVAHIGEASRLLGVSPGPLRAIALVILALAVGFLLFCALRRTPWRRGPIDIDAPGATLVLVQVLLTAVDVFAAAATLWVLLPSVGIGFFAFAAIYVVAVALGVLSHVPGGLGVFELVILYAVGDSAPVNAVAAALVTYRGIYFLLPLLLSTVLLANFELQRSLDTATGRRIGVAASQLAPLFLAATTFTVGAILVASGAIPAFVDRFQILHVGVPLWAVEISHFLTSVAGLFLLFAARGLYYRLDGAWWLALSMTLLSIPFSLIRGLAVVAPSLLIILLIGLVSGRGQFSRRSSLLSQPLTLGWLAATGCVIAAMVWILFFAFRNVEYAHELWWQFEFDAAGPRALRAVLGVAILGLTLGVSQLLRPAAARPSAPTPEEIDRARRIATGQPHPEAVLSLMGDKNFLFSDSGLCFLMFGTHGRTWAALGDPVGTPAEWSELVWRFIELADSHGSRAAFYQIPASSLPLYLDAGLKVLKLGEEARVFLPSFTLEGSERANLRYALKRGERDHLQFEMIPPEHVASIVDELEPVSNAWLSKYTGGGEKRYSVAAFQRDFVLSQPVALVRENGKVAAFATVMTTELRDEVTVGLMRHKPDATSRYAMEYLFIRLIQCFREQGYHTFSLGMVPLSGFHAHRLAPKWHRLARVIWSFGRRFYNFQGLRAFKEKFDPAWEPRYLAASGWFGPYLALIDIAALIGGGVRATLGRRSTVGSRRGRHIAGSLLAIAVATTLFPCRSARALETGDLGELHQVNPTGAMRGLVVLFSDANGWSSVTDNVAAGLARDGALVVGVDLPAYLRRLDLHTREMCHSIVGDIESISRQIQRERGNTSYRTPIVAGIGEGGSVAGVILAQAPAATISGAVAYDPTPSVQTLIPLCSTPAASADSGGGFEYGPWPSLTGFWVVAFPVGSDTPGHRRIAALKAAGTPVEIANGTGGAAETLAALLRPLLAPVATVPVTGIANLPLIELPAEHHGPFLAVFLSGDGGWRDVDKSVAEKLRSDGVSVVGWDSLRYFWSKKTPEQTARDLSAVIDTYASRWGASKVALVGYSFGADVLPFAYNHLSPEAKVRVVQLSLLAFAPAADFEISVAGWLGAAPGKDALPTAPALAPIDPTMVQCFYGAEESDSACPLISLKAEIIRTAGGHHFDNDYSALAQVILDGLHRRGE